jgi:hypothetical protein
MGNCCGGKRDFTQEELKKIVSLQSLARAKIASKKLRAKRDNKLDTLFGKFSPFNPLGDMVQSSTKDSTNGKRNLDEIDLSAPFAL